jgi:prolyl 4-hydroxylase
MKNFIGEYFLEDKLICDKLIELYTNSDYKFEGKFGVDRIINKEVKQSTEIEFSDRFLHDKNSAQRLYVDELQKILNKYIEEYPLCNVNGAFAIQSLIKIQHYKPNEGYLALHCERGTNQEPYSHRHLVFMTYLNDVNDEGGTEFPQQDLIVKPQKGKTLIWPADWTHMHRGIISPTEHKYIITGWFNYIN